MTRVGSLDPSEIHTWRDRNLRPVSIVAVDDDLSTKVGRARRDRVRKGRTDNDRGLVRSPPGWRLSSRAP